ncbi:protein PGR-like [Triticum dicoccoides]|uniref:protein PGR-like n=1 Tax=Triticum dicoccoides TaxID=85692 RepID=UPI001891E4D2|nr:protein PGR-like [Triticum dicoccoides]
MATASIAVRSAFGVALAALIAARAVRRRSLDAWGGAAGFAVMALHLACGYRYGALLLAFFFTSSKVTKIGEDRKRRVEEDFKEGGQRNWIQVLANSAIATVLVILLAIMTGGQDSHLPTHCLNCRRVPSSDHHDRLCLSFALRRSPLVLPVRKGTNGGVTLQGLLAATAGGLTIGLTFVAVGLMTAECSFDMSFQQLLVIPISAAAGLLGSLIDSLLGATLQFSGYCSVRNKVVSKRGPTVTKISGMTILDNDAVNAVSVLLTSVITAYACIVFF